MILGIDFDNTIVCYDQVFHRAADDLGLITPGVQPDKTSIRNHLRLSGKEDSWTELQGLVYGVYIKSAPAFPGVIDFFRDCRRKGITVHIISHKTQHPFIGAVYDLHQSAYEWLESNGLWNKGERDSRAGMVHFELTKEEKMNRIASVGCTHFIDDLPEFLEEPAFPQGVEGILFDPNDVYKNQSGIRRVSSWVEIRSILLNGLPASDDFK